MPAKNKKLVADFNNALFVSSKDAYSSFIKKAGSADKNTITVGYMENNSQLRFFFAHVAGLREDEDEEDEDIDARIFGNIFHSAAEFLYCGKIGRILQADDLRKLHKEVDSCVEKAFVKELFGQDPTTPTLSK